MLTVCPFRCTNFQQIPTFDSGMQVPLSERALHRRYGQLMARKFSCTLQYTL